MGHWLDLLVYMWWDINCMPLSTVLTEFLHSQRIFVLYPSNPLLLDSSLIFLPPLEL